MTATFRVPDRYDVVEFEGEQLAAVSTETPESDRWTEIEIFRTAAGQYVLHRVGRSVVYHRHGGPCNTGVTRPASELDDLSTPCGRCTPPLPRDLDPADVVDDELDKHVTDVVPIDGVYERLLLRRGDRTFMSHPAERALTQATERDPALLAAVTHVRRVG